MKAIDIIIISILIIISALIIYYCFWKNRKNPCKSCPYAKNCNNKNCTDKKPKS